MKEWFDDENFWKDLYGLLFSESRFEHAEEEINAILMLASFTGKSVLDLCCGPGRHSVILAKKGYTVTGVDKTEFLLIKAKELSKSENTEITYINEDMRNYVRENSYDLIINLFTSFGYFKNKDDNKVVLRNMYTSLKKNGKLVMEMMGKEILARIFTKTKSDEFDDGTLFVQTHKIIDNWTNIENNWIILKNGSYKKYTFTHRLYSAAEIEEMLRQAGFKTVDIYGNLNGDKYDNNAQRLVIVAGK